MKIAACYIRVSTDDQLEYSPDSQLEKIQEYAKRNDMILPKEFIFLEEDGVSGRKAAKRQEFQRMIGTAKSKPKPFDVILVWKFSRFARNREDSIVYKSMLRKQGIDVISISENIGDDKMSVITEAIIEAMDEYYSINLGEEVKRGMTEKAKRGEVLSIAPFGYKIVDKKLVIVPEQAEIVHEVFVRYLNGWPMRRLAEWLNDIGIQTKRGNMMENRTIEYWLNNPVYHGYIRWTPTGRTRRDYHNPDSMIVKGVHEPIIEEELWEKTQKLLAERKAKHIKHRRTPTEGTYTLAGIVRCSNCGATLARNNGIYMQCIGYAKSKCKISHHVNANELELRLISAINTDLSSGNFILERSDSRKINSDASALQTRLAREETKLVRIKEAYMAGIDTLEEYKEHKARISEEITRIKEEIGGVVEITPQMRKEFAAKHLKTVEKLSDPSISESDKNALLKEFIKKATYSKAEHSVSVIYLL